MTVEITYENKKITIKRDNQWLSFYFCFINTFELQCNRLGLES
jgi:hypothetical protein